MIYLFLNLLGRLGIFTVAFIILMRFNIVKRLLTGKANRYEKIYLSVIFGLFGIIGTYSGVPINNAIANSRVVGVALGGILGGPFVGLFSGLIAGMHRFFLDMHGFTAIACAVATVAEGFVGGLIYSRLKRRTFDTRAALITGITVETLQMIIILLLAKPFSEAYALVSIIALPMILVNSAGLAIFVELLSSVAREHERVGAFQAQTALKIALKTLPFLRAGLDNSTASRASQIILEETDLDAVAITDETKILAHKGVAEDHHLPGTPLLTAATKQALTLDQTEIAIDRASIGCSNSECTLGSAVIVPLKIGKKNVGALKLYRKREKGINPLDRELAHGLAHLFSNQLELAEIEDQRRLRNDAEIRALQAQINPHFLFNALTTIIRYTRSDPATASDLLLKLSDFFRRNINPGVEAVSLTTELSHCEAYISIEKARFEERVRIRYDIDPAASFCILPPLTLQPLVENAFGHGILPREEGGEIVIGAHKNEKTVKIFVRDDGVGMTHDKVSSILSGTENVQSEKGSGIAIRNVNARLVARYGSECSLKIDSFPGRGTTVSFEIPA
jgi:two-component system, LytTR family, sensor histidine kinase LytS